MSDSSGALSAQKYLSFTTTRKSGERVSTPVWVVDLGDGRAGFYTSSTSGKVKRLAHTPRATVQPCDQRGKLLPGTSPVDVDVEVIRSGAEVDRVRALVKQKYGAPMVIITRTLAKLGGLIKRKPQPYADTVVSFRTP